MNQVEEAQTILKASLSEQDFLQLARFIEGELGIKMPPAKKTMLESRLRKRLRALRLNNFADYTRFFFHDLDRGGDELLHLIDEVTTNKTDFFREPEHFNVLVRTILPQMVSQEGAGVRKPLMAWSAGCSTGEEPYTLALVLEEFGHQLPGLPFRYFILGTDISPRVLQIARRAVYPSERISQIPRNLLTRHFLRSKDPAREVVRVSPEIRHNVRFRQLNFLDGDFGMREPMDIVFFRNVQIYFHRKTQEEILGRIAQIIRPGGYLLIGHSENMNGFNLPFDQLMPTVFRRR